MDAYCQCTTCSNQASEYCVSLGRYMNPHTCQCIACNWSDAYFCALEHKAINEYCQCEYSNHCPNPPCAQCAWPIYTEAVYENCIDQCFNNYEMSDDWQTCEIFYVDYDVIGDACGKRGPHGIAHNIPGPGISRYPEPICQGCQCGSQEVVCHSPYCR